MKGSRGVLKTSGENLFGFSPSHIPLRSTRSAGAIGGVVLSPAPFLPVSQPNTDVSFLLLTWLVRSIRGALESV